MFRDFAFNFLRKLKPFRAQRGAKFFDFAFNFVRKSKAFRARGAPPGGSGGTSLARGYLADA